MVDKLQGQAEVIDLSEMDQYMSGIAVFSIKAKREGFFIFSEFNYPGWKATVDGKDTEILPFRDILMAVRILQGEHKVIFRYFPWKSGLDLGAEKDHEG